MNEVLKLLEDNARLSAEQLSMMLDKESGDIRAMIEKYEQERVILGYKAIIDWDKTAREYVTAIIELKVTPKRDFGFEAIAETIAQFEEVESVYLMSGGYDFSIVVTGRTFQEVAMFVAKRLSTLDSVVSTATHFVLRRYKEKNVMFLGEEQDERGVI